MMQNYFQRLTRENAAEVAALHLDSAIQPFAVGIQSGQPIATETREALDRMLVRNERQKRFLSLKIWLPNGAAYYASDPALIGKNFGITDEIKGALAGQVQSKLEQHHSESAGEQQIGVPLFEVYAPVFDAGGNSVIAVAELYLNATQVIGEITSAAREVWLVGAICFFGIFSLLSLLVQKAARTIVSQNKELDHKVSALQEQLEQNVELSRDLRASHQRFAQVTEQTLRQAGSDIHDGPVQLLALLALRFSTLKSMLKPEVKAQKLHGELSDLADTAVKDLRKIATGLVLPQFENTSLHQVIEMAIRDHEARSHTSVERDFDVCHIECPEVLKVTAYRVVQESLTNAVKHAEASGQHVSFTCQPDIDIRIMDRGKGMSGSYSHENLGLRGMQARMEAIGGRISFELRPGGGTIVHAHLDGARLPELTGHNS